jgi:DNA-binding IclR family transcriptional regulator
MDVLLLFARTSRGELGVTEIAAELGLSKAGVHRVLSSLRSRDLVDLDPSSHRYRLGPAALRLGRAYLTRIDLRAVAAPELGRLAAASGETATLSIRSGDLSLYVDQVVPDGDDPVEVAIGVPHPLHAGAAGRTLLAFLPSEEVDEYLDRVSLQDTTRGGVADVRALREELADTRRLGYAYAFEDGRGAGAGSASAAAPVLDHEGRPAAVASVAGPSERIRAQLPRTVELLLAATGRLSERLGHVPRAASSRAAFPSDPAWETRREARPHETNAPGGLGG